MQLPGQKRLKVSKVSDIQVIMEKPATERLPQFGRATSLDRWRDAKPGALKSEVRRWQKKVDMLKLSWIWTWRSLSKGVEIVVMIEASQTNRD
ncbi:hypothetical protein A1507_13185 [Methylomonas koyamae]|uniref:Uncharacterized protein n=1 Tax=Methylomonas koyamae TaxID=702114 RepID=A0A177NEB6_9GAMM|nr:hypothetical protein A1507_13185 [Methylomonas koyamae]